MAISTHGPAACISRVLGSPGALTSQLGPRTADASHYLTSPILTVPTCPPNARRAGYGPEPTGPI